MQIIRKIKNKFYELKYQIRYKKFKNCSIPYQFYDNKRNTFEWVMYDNNTSEYKISNNLQKALENNINYNLIYHYKAKIYGREKSNQEMKYRMMVSHCHSFDEIIAKLYYPETFEIPKEYLNEYSKQELDFLKQLKNYLKLIELKDYKISEKSTNKKITQKENLMRYENSKAKEYSMIKPIWFKDITTALAIINGTKDYMIDINYSFSSNKLNEKWLVIAENTYLGIVEVTKEDIIKFKNLEENMVNYKQAGFKNFNDYKKSLLNKFKRECNLINESFTEESFIKYLKLKVIKKLKKFY